MRTIEWTRQFKRDHRRVKATPRYKDIDVVLEFVTNLLAHDGSPTLARYATAWQLPLSYPLIA